MIFWKNCLKAFKQVVMDSETRNGSVHTYEMQWPKLWIKVNDVITKKWWRKQNNEPIMKILDPILIIWVIYNRANWFCPRPTRSAIYNGGYFYHPLSTIECPTKSPTRIGLQCFLWWEWKNTWHPTFWVFPLRLVGQF